MLGGRKGFPVFLRDSARGALLTIFKKKSNCMVLRVVKGDLSLLFWVPEALMQRSVLRKASPEQLEDAAWGSK